MNVRLEIMFESLTEENEASLRRVAFGLTNDPQSVRVVPREGDPQWLIAEFTMPTEAQYKAVDKIDGKVRFSLWNRMDSIIAFPKSEQEHRRAQRIAAQRRARRQKNR